jgi:hypothetical protein
MQAGHPVNAARIITGAQESPFEGTDAAYALELESFEQ